MKLSEQVRIALESYYVEEERLIEDDRRLVSLIEEMEEALEFYADTDNWEFTYSEDSCDCCRMTFRPKAEDDMGDLARKVMEKIK